MKRCFIIGAGASIGHTKGIFPSIETFFNKLNEKNAKEYLPRNLFNIKSMMRSFIFDRFGLIVENDPVNIETILTEIDIDLEQSPNDPFYSGLRLSLIEFIQSLLIALQDITNIDKGEYHLLHEILTPMDTIITFNWDCLVDDIFERKDILSGTKSASGSDQYSHFYRSLSGPSEYMVGRMHTPKPIELCDVNKGTANDEEPNKKQQDENQGYYLKMHGSVDWLYCKNQTCRTYPHIFPTDRPQAKKACSYCYEQLYNMIIPPVLNKSIREHPTIRRIWNLARIELMKSDEIVIWGYSLPTTDFHSKWLLRQARFGGIKKLVLINCTFAENNDESTKLRQRLLEPFHTRQKDPHDPFRKPQMGHFQLEEYPTFGDYYAAISGTNDA